MTVYGDGFGRVTYPEVSAQDTGDGRREKSIVTTVGGRRVTIIIRDTIVPEDPYLNLVRASAYTFQARSGSNSRFPVPPVGRDIKDFLIRTNVVI